MFAAFRILRDVIIYRIRKREMANLASSLTIMIALQLAPWDVGVRFLFALALNVAVYLVNDIYDVHADLTAASKDNAKTTFLRSHEREAWFALSIPVFLMVVIGLVWARELLVVLGLAGGVCWAYSARLKHLPYLDLFTIFVCGVAGSMPAFPLDRTLGWCFAGLLGCFAACFQTVQMVRDHDDDAAFGTRTTAVALGPAGTILLQRVLLVVAAIYALLIVHRWVGILMLLSVLLPFRAKEADVHWNRVRVALGLAWLAMVGWVGWTGSSWGWLVQVDRFSVLR